MGLLGVKISTPYLSDLIRVQIFGKAIRESVYSGHQLSLNNQYDKDNAPL
jgi:hypothetical protein